MKLTAKLYQLRFFFGTIALLLIIAGVILFSNDKTSIHLAINSLHSASFDFFFKYFTYVGDGFFVAFGILVLGLFALKENGWRPLVYGWLLLIISGAAAQFFKRVVFPDALRPSAFLQGHELHLVDGVQMHAHHSFPSGHSTAAFAFFGFVTIYYFRNKPFFQVLMALTAALVGYSRMYLSQHFLEDIVAGTILGCSFLVVLLLVDRKNSLLR